MNERPADARIASVLSGRISGNGKIGGAAQHVIVGEFAQVLSR